DFEDKDAHQRARAADRPAAIHRLAAELAHLSVDPSLPLLPTHVPLRVLPGRRQPLAPLARPAPSMRLGLARLPGGLVLFYVALFRPALFRPALFRPALFRPALFRPALFRL